MQPTAMRKSTLGRPPNPKRIDRRNEKILRHATRFFAKRGYHAADMQVLADELKIGKGTLYRAYRTKEALFLATTQEAMRLMRESIDGAISAGGADGLEAIAHAVAAYLRFFDQHPHFVEIMMLERSVFGDTRKPTYFVHREANAERWSRLYAKLMDEGRVRRLPIEAIRDVMSSTIYGAMFTNYFAGRQKPLEVQAAQIIHVVLNGILTNEERVKPCWSLQSLSTKFGADA